MHTTVTATLTNRIDIDTLTPDVSVDIAAEDNLPHEMILAAVEGACRATLLEIDRVKYAALFGAHPDDGEEGS